jgi:hypothetical protein
MSCITCKHQREIPVPGCARALLILAGESASVLHFAERTWMSLAEMDRCPGYERRNTLARGQKFPLKGAP